MNILLVIRKGRSVVNNRPGNTFSNGSSDILFSPSASAEVLPVCILSLGDSPAFEF